MASLLRIWIVRYADPAGKRVPKGAPGAKKVRERSTVWYGQFKDPAGRWKRVPLYTDKQASRIELDNLVKRVAQGKVGLVNPYQEHLVRPVNGHVADYLSHLVLEGVNPKHYSERRRILDAVFSACGVRTLADLTGDRVDRYLASMRQSARTKDTHRGAVHAFAGWLVRQKRLPENPVSATAKPRGEVKRPRRAESVENLQRLLAAARERPLLEARTVRKGGRAGERYAEIRPEVAERLLRVGRERALVYKTAVLTGLREGELRRLQVCHLRSGEAPSLFVAPAHDRKNKTPFWLPLLPEHATELGAWIEDTGKVAADLVFYVPEKPNNIFRRDLKHAGIPYKDEHGCYFDFHSLRHCTDTYLNAAGVAPSVVMLFMRHRHIKLSLQTYNDPRMHDARKALAALPRLDSLPRAERAG